MPIEYKFYEKNALKTIESIQKGIGSNDFATMSEKSKRDLYASIFGMRYAANAVRGKKDSLKVPVSLDAFQDKRDEMALCPTFQGFINAQGHDGMVRLIKEGHSGAAEEAFQKYVLEHAKLPADVPDRYMPTASERIKQQQKKLDSINPRSDEAVAIYAEIFRTRRAVDAVRKKGSTVEAKVNGRKYAQTEDLTNNEVFKGFVKQYGAALRSEAQTGNAGAAEEMFQDHLLKQDHIPAGAPKDYMPTAEDRIDMFEIVARCPPDEKLVVVALPSFCRDRDRHASVEIIGCDGVCLQYFFWRPLEYYFASFPSCTRADVDDVIGIQHHVLIVFHHDDGIAQVTKLLE